eukprot:g16402.t2
MAASVFAKPEVVHVGERARASLQRQIQTAQEAAGCYLALRGSRRSPGFVPALTSRRKASCHRHLRVQLCAVSEVSGSCKSQKSPMCEVPRRSTCSALLGTVATSAGATEPRQQVAAAMQKLEDLTNPDNFKKIAAGGGDNIRREVGTVGMTSPLGTALSLIVLTCVKALTNADADAYSSIFSMNSAAATSPQVYINKAFEDESHLVFSFLSDRGPASFPVRLSLLAMWTLRRLSRPLGAFRRLATSRNEGFLSRLEEERAKGANRKKLSRKSFLRSSKACAQLVLSRSNACCHLHKVELSLWWVGQSQF